MARNVYGGYCRECGRWTPPGFGHFERYRGGWRVHCVECASGRKILYQSMYLTAIDECLPDGECGFDVLADLIDRGECENVYDGSVQDSCDNGFLCSVCGCKVEDEEHYRVSGVWNFCPGCGRRVVKR